MSNGGLKLPLAVLGVACAATTAFAASKRIGRSTSGSARGHFDIPSEILRSDCQCKDELVLAVRLALAAGANMEKHYNSKGTADENIDDLDISTKKNDADFATAIDVMNEALISNEVRAAFPAHEVIGEESVGTGSIPSLTRVPTWIIDPIDGTTNFASGLPLSCVSIGFCLEGQPYMGVVYSPFTNELYIGVEGVGSFRNGVRLLACVGEKATKQLSGSVVCFEFGYARTEEGVTNMIDAVRRLLRHGVRSTRSLGAGVLDLCYTACGRMDVVYTGLADEGWKPWDYAAGLVIAMEAGCTMSHLKICGEEDRDEKGDMRSGYNFNLYSNTMICGVNENLVDQCRSVVLGD